MPTYNTVPTRRTVVDADDFSLLVDCRKIPVRSEYPEVERVAVEKSGTQTPAIGPQPG